MKTRHRVKARVWAVLAMVCGGGLLPGNCMIRTKQATIQGSKTFLANVLLNPENLTGLPYGDVVNNLTGNESEDG